MASLKRVEYIDSKVLLARFDLHNVRTMDDCQVIIDVNDIDGIPARTYHFKKWFEYSTPIKNIGVCIVGRRKTYDGHRKFARRKGEEILWPSVDGV